jgi:hypothetical protein
VKHTFDVYLYFISILCSEGSENVKFIYSIITNRQGIDNGVVTEIVGGLITMAGVLFNLQVKLFNEYQDILNSELI